MGAGVDDFFEVGLRDGLVGGGGGLWVMNWV